jgi:hypothetical protein
MSSLDFDYEFIFTSGNFDQLVYNNCILLDNSNTRQNIVEFTISEIQTIFINLPRIQNFSTFINVDGKKYKITVCNVI